MSRIIQALVALFFVILLLVALGQGGFSPWHAVLPSLLAIAIAICTKKVLLGLGLGLFSGGCLAVFKNGALSLALGTKESVGYLLSTLGDMWNLQVLGFVFLMIATIHVLSACGALQSLLEKVARFAVSRQSACLLTVCMGLIIFFDDYANSMVVGSSARRLTDRFAISRAKLAFLIDATSAPIAGLAVISTWIGYEVGLFSKASETLGIGIDGYSMFLDAIGFRFYCLFMLVFVFLIAWSGRDFGTMAKAEALSLEAKNDGSDSEFPRVSPWVALVPMLILFLGLGVGLWIDGRGGAAEKELSIFSWTDWRTILVHAENNVLVFAVVSLIAFVASSLLSFAAGLRWRHWLAAVVKSFRIAAVPAAILVMSWSLKMACDDLETGRYLAQFLTAAVAPTLFPAVLFILGALVAFATGTSWGTMSLLIPISIPVAYAFDGGQYGLITMICLASVLDGAILGDHASPISDTTILSSTASGCDHVEHVRTQIPYALTVGAVALLFGYLPAAQGVDSFWLILSGMGALLLVVFGLGRPLVPGSRGPAGKWSVAKAQV